MVLFIDRGVVESWELGKATESRGKLEKAEEGWKAGESLRKLRKAGLFTRLLIDALSVPPLGQV